MAQQEAVETIGDLDASGTVDALISIAWEHQTVDVQREAVETLGDRRDDRAALAAIERIAREHDREEVQAEALETLADSHEPLHPILLELALSGRSTGIRREAVEAIGEAVTKVGDAQLIDRAQTVIERAVFEDPDRSVQMEALEALEDFPSARAISILRDVIARHPDPRVRREAEEQVRERQ
jgi:HEAT repeat protein